MPPRLPARILNDIERHELISAGGSVIVALSGGPDSVALIRLLHEMRGELGIDLRAAHCNHRLRGPDSDADEEFVRALCGRLDIELQVERTQPPAGSGNLEERLREVRYGFLARAASGHEAVIATGHTRDDLVETLVLNLFRGAGPAGLASIPWKRRTDGTTVIRPLLGCRREELIQELQRLEQDWRHDPSNDDTTPNRNWLRHELLPLVAGRLNPNLAETLAGTADLMAGLNRWISTQVDELGIVDPARIPLETLQSAPEMLRRAAVRECLRSVRGNLGSITLRHIDAVLGLSVKQTGRRVDLPGLRAEREFDALVLYRPDDDVEPFSVPLQVPGTTGLPGIGKAVSIEILRTSSNGQQAANTALLSPPPGPLIARNRLPGDRYRIKGRPEKRAKRLLSESRVPRRQRDRLVFIVSGNRLLWIEGFPPNAEFLRDFETSLQVTVQSFPAAGG